MGDWQSVTDGITEGIQTVRWAGSDSNVTRLLLPRQGMFVYDISGHSDGFNVTIGIGKHTAIRSVQQIQGQH